MGISIDYPTNGTTISGEGTSDHSALTNLGADDHFQYLYLENRGAEQTIQDNVHVSGLLTVSGLAVETGASSGYILTSDANGNASWQALPVGTISHNDLAGLSNYDNHPQYLYIEGRGAEQTIQDSVHISGVLTVENLNVEQDTTIDGDLTVTTNVVLDGSLKLTTSPTAGHVLTSDASGNASWEAVPAASGVGGSSTDWQSGFLASNSAKTVNMASLASWYRYENWQYGDYNGDITYSSGTYSFGIGVAGYYEIIVTGAADINDGVTYQVGIVTSAASAPDYKQIITMVSRNDNGSKVRMPFTLVWMGDLLATDYMSVWCKASADSESMVFHNMKFMIKRIDYSS